MGRIRRWLNKDWIVVLFAAAAVMFFIWPSPAQRFSWDHLTEKSGFLAAWITAIGVIFAWYQIRASRRSARFKIAQEKFNDPAMRFSRAALAWSKLNPEDSAISSLPLAFAQPIPNFGWEIVDFLNSIGKLVEASKVEFEDVEMAFARHVLGICGNKYWKQHITAVCLKSRYAPLLNLYQRMIKGGRVIDTADEMKVGIFDEPFWRSEMSLAPGKEVEDAVPIIRVNRKKLSAG